MDFQLPRMLYLIWYSLSLQYKYVIENNNDKGHW